MSLSSGADPLELHSGACQILASRPASVAYRRACAVVVRQAMEAAVREALVGIDHPRISWRSQFLLLQIERKRTDARHGYLLWRTWSDHAHYRSYDLIPDAPALTEQLVITRTWITGLSAQPTPALSNQRKA